MLRRRTIRGRKSERGIVILLVAIVLLFVISAIAALAIDLVTFYTARSEAQLAADAAALAGARVLANSGMTSRPSDTTLSDNAVILARTIATQVGRNNQVGGRNLNGAGSPLNCGQEICVAFNDTDPAFGTNPHVTVQVTRSDLPTFFARIWGRGTVVVKATATAEAYNPSGMATLGKAAIRVAPTCVKPWVLPNIDPSQPPGPPFPQIFDPTTGAVVSPTLLGYTVGYADPNVNLRNRCNTCPDATAITPKAWRYYQGANDPASFPVPSQSLPTCSNIAAPDAYQYSVAGCVPRPIACNSTVNLDTTSQSGRRAETARAVNCLTHAIASQGDQVEALVIATPFITSPPFQFLAGNDNPVVRRTDVQVSDSLVTVPVYDSGDGTAVPPNPATIIGFAQLFLQPDGTGVPTAGANLGHITTTVVNLVGCGTTATGQPILGHGSSPVPVRLITPP